MKTLLTALVVVVVGSLPAGAQDAKAVLDSAAQAMGANEVTSIQFSGTGFQFLLGQAVVHDAPWPRFKINNYIAAIDYEVPFMRRELYRAQGEQPPRGGGPQPVTGEQRQVQFVGGTYAWNQGGQNFNPAPAAVSDRLLDLWTTPHGFIKAAQANNATVRKEQQRTVVSFTLLGSHQVNGTFNDQYLLERVETVVDNPVLGDMLMETTYSDYRDFGEVKFPGRIVQKQGGRPILDLTIVNVGVNNVAVPEVPVNVQVQGDVVAAPAEVDVNNIVTWYEGEELARPAIARGIWYLTGATHHSVAVEFSDHLVVIEGPLSEERSLAVIAELARHSPKPIKYLINTHQHFDHAGGIRTYAAEGVTHHHAPGERAVLSANLLEPPHAEPGSAGAIESEAVV